MGHRQIRGRLTRCRPDVGYTLRMNQNRPPMNAYHEAGHAVFAWRFRVQLQSVWIRPASTSGGTECDGECHSPREWAIIYLAGMLAQLRAHPASWPFNARNDILKFEDLTAPLMSDDPAVRERLRAEAEVMIADTRTWRAIEALATVLTERSSLRGVEAIEIIRFAYGDGMSIV